MKIEGAAQVRTGYRKSAASATPSRTFGQVLEAKTQDRYVPSAPPPRTEAEFSLAERTYGCVTVSNATHAKLKQLAELNAQADYTGMSPDEIYAEIWNRYDEAFDGNMIAIRAGIAGPAEWWDIDNQFYDEIMRHIFNPAIIDARKEGLELDGRPYAEWTDAETDALESSSLEKAHNILYEARLKVLGYDGMSFEEREAAIREKYAGKNTTSDFLNMQSELRLSGVLNHKMGLSTELLYCDMLRHQFEVTFNPNDICNVGPEKCSLMTADQWYRVADQPFDMAKLAAELKKQLARISGPNGWTEDYVKMMEGFFDHFVTGAVDDSLDQLLEETKE